MSTSAQIITEPEVAAESRRRGFSIPLIFFGIGIYRAWIEIIYTHPPVEIPIVTAIGGNLQDVILGFCLLGAALLSRFLHPLYSKRALVWTATGAMCLATILEFWSVFNPAIAPVLALPSTLLSSWGLSVLILLWCELFSCLNTFRVILYFSGALILGWVICYFLSGLSVDRLAVAATLLPLLSTGCALSGFAALGKEDFPRATAKTGVFPWKILLAVAIYTFAFGLFENSASAFGGPLSSWGMVVAAISVFVIALVFADRLRIESLFRFALPLMILGLLLASQFTLSIGGVSHFFIDTSYAVFLIFIMALMCDFSRRSGVSAIWLFGIERFVRFIAYAAGVNIESLFNIAAPAASTGHLVLVFVSVALIAFVTVLLLADSSLLGHKTLSAEAGDGARDRRVAHIDLVESLATSHGLTSREKEVLDLLLKDKTIPEIERELYISDGTVRAHIQHIYRKFDVHSRQELGELVGE